MLSKFITPTLPYIREHPKSKSPDDNAPSMKYFKPASLLRGLSRCNVATMYRDKLCSSNPTYKASKD